MLALRKSTAFDFEFPKVNLCYTTLQLGSINSISMEILLELTYIRQIFRPYTNFYCFLLSMLAQHGSLLIAKVDLP